MNIIDDCLVVPIDTRRADEDLEAFRQEISEMLGDGKIRRVLLDMSNVLIIDAYQADVVVDIAAVARMFGATTVLYGIRPAVAAALALIKHRIIAIPACQGIEDALAFNDAGLPGNEVKALG